ncbi:MAG: hypothetical protein R3C58_04040 [Parvularculaceae bacterium]
MAALIEVDAAVIEPATGLEGDHAGRDPDRAVTVLSAEAWAEALSLLPPGGASESLPWTTWKGRPCRGVRLPRAKGGVFRSAPSCWRSPARPTLPAYGGCARGPSQGAGEGMALAG